MKPEHQPVDAPIPQALSKRAARRLIQRAFVLTGRDKHLRQHLREAHLTTLWVVEDWDLTWTVILGRGGIEFERRPAKKPDVVLTWPTAEKFFQEVEYDSLLTGAHQFDGKQELRRFSEPLLKGFFKSLCHVLRYPVGDTGESLL